MAYLDWDKSENNRLDAQVAEEIRRGPSNTRGMRELWRRAEQDGEEQQALYEARQEDDDYIMVQS